MKDYQNPIDILNQIYKFKYKLLALPILIILIDFVIRIILPIEIVKYISAFALIIFIFVHLMFRMNRPDTEINESNLLAPINGKIKDIKKLENSYQIIIDKSFLMPSEIRTMCNLDSFELDETMPSFSVKGMWAKLYSEKTPHPQGQLIGIAPGKALAIINIPLSYELSVNVSNNINAGMTIMATSKNSSSISNIGREDE